MLDLTRAADKQTRSPRALGNPKVIRVNNKNYDSGGGCDQVRLVRPARLSHDWLRADDTRDFKLCCACEVCWRVVWIEWMDAERSSAVGNNMEDGWFAQYPVGYQDQLPSARQPVSLSTGPNVVSGMGRRGAKEKGEKDKTWNKTGPEKASDGGKKRKEVDRWTAVPTGCWGFPSFHPFVMRRRLVTSSGGEKKMEFLTGEREKGRREGKGVCLGTKAAFLPVCVSVCLSVCLSSVFMYDMKMEAGTLLGAVTEQQLRDGEGEDGQDTPCVVYRACTRPWKKAEKRPTGDAGCICVCTLNFRGPGSKLGDQGTIDGK